MSNELLVIEKLELELVPFFTKGDRLDELLEAIKVEVMAHVPDASTNKGRTLIKNNITAAKKYRTHLESSGKALSAEYKLIPSAIDATRKKVNEFLLGVEANARESLTEWERIDKIEKKQISDTAAYLIKFDADLEEGHRDNELFDFKLAKAEADRQAEIKAASEKAAAEAKAQAEAEAAERIAQAERDKIAAEQREIAAKQAVIDAENKAAQDAIDAAAREAKAKQDAIDAKERARYEAEQAEQRRIKLERQAKQDAFLADQRVKYEAEQAENRRVEAENQAKINAEVAAENARLAEVQRQNNIAKQQKREQAKLEADKNHVASIKRDIMADFISIGLDDTAARLATRALAAKKIRHTGINY